MTLPKTYALEAKDINNFENMSFEATTITNLSLSNQALQALQHQPAQNSQQPILSSLQSIMSSLSPITYITNSQTNDAMLVANANENPLVPLQMISENVETELLVECVMPSIYLTKDFILCKEEKLRGDGYTHIIIIDKHIQELYYPNQQPDIFKLCSLNSDKNKNIRHGARSDNSSSMNAFDYYCTPPNAANHLTFSKEFKVIELNFGEKSYLTTVLPNCYRAVKFINKALQAGGTILVIDCNGSEQKCLTITVAYLMYKHNISFSNAFDRLKEFYKKADLDRFYMSQLYEYEPILQVQRAQSRGQSCSRKFYSAILKRKKTDDDNVTLDNSDTCPTSSTSSCYDYTNSSIYTNATTKTELINNCNPLNRFDSTQMKRQEIKPSGHRNHLMMEDNCNMSGATLSTTKSGWYNWDDYAME